MNDGAGVNFPIQSQLVDLTEDGWTLTLSPGGHDNCRVWGSVLSAAAHRFIQASDESIDQAIELTLKDIGQAVEASRCYLIEFNHDRSQSCRIWEWSAECFASKIGPLLQPVSSDSSWVRRQVRGHHSLVVNNVAQLPDAAEVEKKWWQSQKVTSLLISPVLEEGSPIGLLGLDVNCRKRHWEPADVAALEHLAKIIASAWARRKNSRLRYESQDWFSTMADAAAISIWRIDETGTISYANRQLIEYAGLDVQVEPLQMLSLVHPDEQSQLQAAFLNTVGRGRYFQVEARLRRRDGEYRWMQVTGNPIRGEGSEKLNVLGTCIDITDHRIAEEQLLVLNDSLERHVLERTRELASANQALSRQMSEKEHLLADLKKLNRAVEQSPASIVITDLDGRIEYVNPRFTEVTGYTVEDVSGQDLRILNGVESNKDFRELWETVTAGNEWRGEFHSRRKNGKSFWEMASISPITTSSGEVSHFLAVKEDITERKRLEWQLRNERDDLRIAKEDLQKAYDELKATQSQMLQQEKMASIGQLAAGVAHEINNPVGFVKSNLTTLQKYVDRLNSYLMTTQQVIATAGEPFIAQVEAVRKQLNIDYLLEDVPELLCESLDGVGRVQTIVQNLKTFSRVDQAEYASADINECLETTINMVWNELKYKVTLEKNFQPLPMLICHPQQLNQVFLNILVNASHAIDKQGLVKVATRPAGDLLCVEISDNGCGMTEQVKKRIFEPFFTTKEVGKGTGLGMSISYDIVQKHGGKIEVDSAPGQGTTFRILLPMGKVATRFDNLPLGRSASLEQRQ
jgi:PAS domain S-box-containing protein